MVGTKYTNRHDKVGTYVHWVLLKYLGIKVCSEWFKHEPESVVEKGNTVIMWDHSLITEKKVGANRPDITIHDRGANEAKIIDFLVPYDMNIMKKNSGKIN